MRNVFKYLKANLFFTLFIGYELVACLLKLATGINVTIPCLYSKIFGMKCAGCGLTSAFIELLKMNPAHAWEHNPLIFIVIPAATSYVVWDIMKFRKKILQPVVSN